MRHHEQQQNQDMTYSLVRHHEQKQNQDRTYSLVRHHEQQQNKDKNHLEFKFSVTYLKYKDAIHLVDI